MRLQIIAVGKLRNKSMKVLAEDYHKRLNRYLKVEVVEVREARKVESRDTTPALEEEARNLLDAVAKGATIVAMDERGKQPSSEELAKDIHHHMNYGQSDMAFLVGGALGLHPSVREKARHVIALSRMTLPHEMARVFLLEQLYRSMTILRGEPYHK